MASVNFREEEYVAVASGAMDAYRHGDMQQAKALNQLASKMNMALSAGKLSGLPQWGNPKKKFRAPGPIDKELGIGESSGDNGL